MKIKTSWAAPIFYPLKTGSTAAAWTTGQFNAPAFRAACFPCHCCVAAESVCSIARESIFTGLNNFRCYGMDDAQFTDKIGFTEAEVKRMLAEAGLSDKFFLLRKWRRGIHGEDAEADIVQHDQLS